MNTEFVLIEACDFTSSPVGGQLNFARNLMKQYGGRIALAGLAENPAEPVGCWFRKTIDGVERDHFNFGFINFKSPSRVPRRLIAMLMFLKQARKIARHSCRRVFLQEHGLLMAIDRSHWESICYRFPGVESQLDKSTYAWAKLFSAVFDMALYFSSRKADVLLASADRKAISEVETRFRTYTGGRKFIQFPTRVDTEIFRLRNFRLSSQSLEIITCSRLHWVKGWDLLLESFALIQSKDATLTFIGDGPDRDRFNAKVRELGLEKRITLTGYLPKSEIAKRLACARVFVMTSHMEGWPTALVEASVVGLPMVSTDVSGAQDIIREGANGFICRSRNPFEIAALIETAASLDVPEVMHATAVERFSLASMESDISRFWLDAAKRGPL